MVLGSFNFILFFGGGDFPPVTPWILNPVEQGILDDIDVDDDDNDGDIGVDHDIDINDDDAYTIMRMEIIMMKTMMMVIMLCGGICALVFRAVTVENLSLTDSDLPITHTAGRDEHEGTKGKCCSHPYSSVRQDTTYYGHLTIEHQGIDGQML